MLLLKQMQEHTKFLRESYKELRWYQRLFFPWKLGRTLSNLQNQEFLDVLPVYQAVGETYMSRTGFISRWLFPSLEAFIDKSLWYLYPASQEGSSYLSNLTELMKEAYHSGLLEKNFENLLGRLNLITSSLIILKKASLLTEANFVAIINHRSPSPFIYALDYFYDFGLLGGEYGQANFNALKANNDSKWNMHNIALAIKKLQGNELIKAELAQEVIQFLIRNEKKPKKSVKELLELQHDLLAMRDYTAAIIRHAADNTRWRFSALPALKILSQLNLLDGEQGRANFELMLNYECPNDFLIRALALFKESGLLTGELAQANLYTLAASENRKLLELLPNQKISQEEFDAALSMYQQAGITIDTTDKKAEDRVRNCFASTGSKLFVSDSVANERRNYIPRSDIGFFNQYMREEEPTNKPNPSTSTRQTCVLQ